MNKGHRIRFSDKDLLFRFGFDSLLFIFFAVFILFYIVDILNFDWKNFSLLRISDMLSDLDITYLVVALSVSFFVCSLAVLIYMRFCKVSIIKKRHIQAIARMIVENGWYESEIIKNSGSYMLKKEKVAWFPKIFYKLKDNRIYINIVITMGKAQEKYLTLDKRIETALFCEFIEFNRKEPYYEYVFYYDLSRTRLDISDVNVVDGGIELMKGFVWQFNKLPHALVVGGTGSGKTYFLLILITALVNSSAELYILDPKNADLADLNSVIPNVYHDKEGIIECIQTFCNDMLDCSENMKKMNNYKTGNNYADLGLPPHFLVFDEYVAFFEMLDKKTVDSVFSYLKRIAMLGRQAGFFLILASQRADSKYLSDGVRDQFHFRVALGRNSDIGYKMVFGDTDKAFLTMPAGRGYADMGQNIITEFYSPYVPHDYDFLNVISKLTGYSKSQADCESFGEIDN